MSSSSRVDADDIAGLTVMDPEAWRAEVEIASEDMRLAPRRVGLPRATRKAIEATTICPLCDAGPDEPCRSVKMRSWHKACSPHTHRITAWHDAGLPRGRA